MNWNKDKDKEFEILINNFSLFVKAHIQKFNIQKMGIDPDDVLQEIKIKLWKMLEDEKIINNYASYIRKVVDSSVIDFLRKLRKEKTIFLHEKQKWISEQKINYLTDSSFDEGLKNTLNETVNSLIESRRNVVRLFLLGMTIDEISTFLKWSKDKTRNLLYRGLSDLKKKLREKGIEYENK
jgi:RNA polymerase sigma-70 factor (ECF subfamily)